MAENKDTIYIDIDDEITSIIDKVHSSKKKIIALVLPKRAAVLQSIVNMKLLKKAADKGDKNIVLITSEHGILPLAGAVGLHVAKTLQSKPEIPDVPAKDAGEEEPEELGEGEVDKSKSIGELAGATALAGAVPKEETVELDNTAPEAEVSAAKSSSKRPKRDKKSKVPDFDMFRKKLFLGIGGLILLIVLWIFAFHVLPKASINIKTETSDANANPTVTLDTGAKAVDEATLTIPGEFKQVKKTESQTGTATGQKDVGTKAGGSITIRNCDYPSGFTISAGTRFTGDNSKVFVSTTSAAVPAFSGPASLCTQGGSNSGKATVSVQAEQNGDSYNVASQNYAFSYSSSKVDAVGSAMTGGSSKIATVISQQDLDAAKAKLPNDKEPAKAELTKALQDDKLLAMNGTFSESPPAITTSPNVGDQASTFTITAVTNYTMLGAKEDDLKKMLDASVKSQIDPNKQQIQDYHLDTAAYTVANNKDNAVFQVQIQVTVAVGPKINIDDLKKQIGGKKKGQIHDYINALPGVKDVTVKITPFWASKSPKKPSKITITFEKSNGNNQ